MKFSIFVAVFVIRYDELISVLNSVIFTFLMFLYDIVYVHASFSENQYVIEWINGLTLKCQLCVLLCQAGHCLLILPNLRYDHLYVCRYCNMLFQVENIKCFLKLYGIAYACIYMYAKVINSSLAIHKKMLLMSQVIYIH